MYISEVDGGSNERRLLNDLLQVNMTTKFRNSFHNIWRHFCPQRSSPQRWSLNTRFPAAAAVFASLECCLNRFCGVKVVGAFSEYCETHWHLFWQFYNSLERPVFNESEAVGLQLGLTLQQIIDVVIIIPLPSAIYTFSSMNTFIYIFTFYLNIRGTHGWDIIPWTLPPISLKACS